jgi:ATP-dependent DNA helicase RecG
LCLLVTDVDRHGPAGERLAAVERTSDGFVLSQVDLEQRREGDVLGAAQSGTRTSLRLLRLLDDEPLILEARQAAAAIVEEDPTLERHPALRAAVDQIVDAERAQYLEKT